MARAVRQHANMGLADLRHVYCREASVVRSGTFMLWGIAVVMLVVVVAHTTHTNQRPSALLAQEVDVSCAGQQTVLLVRNPRPALGAMRG